MNKKRLQAIITLSTEMSKRERRATYKIKFTTSTYLWAYYLLTYDRLSTLLHFFTSFHQKHLAVQLTDIVLREQVPSFVISATTGWKSKRKNRYPYKHLTKFEMATSRKVFLRLEVNYKGFGNKKNVISRQRPVVKVILWRSLWMFECEIGVVSTVYNSFPLVMFGMAMQEIRNRFTK